MQPSKKRKRSDPPTKECRFKRRKKVFETVSQLKKDGISKGIYAQAARMLDMSADDVRNDYRAEENLLRTSPLNSAIARLELSNGTPKTKVNKVVASLM